MLMLVVVLPLTRDVAGCNFPDFLQSLHSADDATGRRDWRTHWRQHAFLHNHDDDSYSTSSTSAEIFVDGSIMRAEDATRLRRRQVNATSNQTLHPHHGRSERHRLRPHHRRFSFTRRCRQVVLGDDGRARYLVTHRQHEESHSKSICIEFVQRSDTVVQVPL